MRLIPLEVISKELIQGTFLKSLDRTTPISHIAPVNVPFLHYAFINHLASNEKGSTHYRAWILVLTAL